MSANTDLIAFGKYVAASVRDNCNPRTTDDELDAMVAELAEEFAHLGEDEFLAEAAKGCRNCAQCSPTGVPCGACQAGGVCDAFPCTCHERDSDLDDADDYDDHDTEGP